MNYNPNGGSPQLPRLVSPNNRRIGNPPNLPPRVQGGGPVQGLAQGGGQAHQPGLLQELPRDNGRNADGEVGRLHTNSNPEANTKESKYEVSDNLSEEFRNLAVYSPTHNVAVESITNCALAGELDSAETAGTNVQLRTFRRCRTNKRIIKE